MPHQATPSRPNHLPYLVRLLLVEVSVLCFGPHQLCVLVVAQLALTLEVFHQLADHLALPAEGDVQLAELPA
jgi:hypothetical protein